MVFFHLFVIVVDFVCNSLNFNPDFPLDKGIDFSPCDQIYDSVGDVLWLMLINFPVVSNNFNEFLAFFDISFGIFENLVY